MSRWTRAAPPHRDAWRPWLAFPGSLTRSIVERHGDVRVRIVSQGLRKAGADERRTLGLRAGALVYLREVALHAGGRPVVLARSITAPRDLKGTWRELHRLGTRPLAELLFADRKVHRTPFEFARIAPGDPLWERAKEAFGRCFPALAARRSRFTRHGRALLVTEVFLPELATSRERARGRARRAARP